jgi:hypothetical protein
MLKSAVKKLLPYSVRRVVRRTIAGRPQQLWSTKAVQSQCAQVFSIGMYAGSPITGFVPWPEVRNPVLTRNDVTDVPAAFVADPFMIFVADQWYMFFEVYNTDVGRGEIGFATSKDGKMWHYRKIILREPFHLSYPYVFSYDGQFYMVPETCAEQKVWLYSATEFPEKWERLSCLIEGRDCVDPSLFFFDNKWWLYCSEGKAPQRADVLRLFYSDGLEGPWREHPASPVVSTERLARPAGRVIVKGSSVFRFSQNCSDCYGLSVNAFIVDTLTTAAYHEMKATPTPILQPGADRWNAGGMHHLDAHLREPGFWIACVDGWYWA